MVTVPYRKYRRSDPRRYAKLALVRLGRRGVVLALFGFLYVAQGISVVGPSGGFNAGFDYITGSLWIIAGLTAFYNAPRPQGKDVWGFYALIVMGMWLAVTSLGLFVASLVPGGDVGSRFGLVAAVAYFGLFVGGPLVTLGWRENVNPETGRFE